MILGWKQQTLFLNDPSFLYGKWGEYCITSPLRYNCSFLETLCLYCGTFSFCVKQIKLKQSSRSPERKIYWFIEGFLKNRRSFLEVLVPACWTVVLSHSLTNDQYHLNTEKLIQSRNLIKWWEDIAVAKLSLRGVKRKVCSVLDLQLIWLTSFGVEISFFEGGVGWLISYVDLTVFV